MINVIVFRVPCVRPKLQHHFMVEVLDVVGASPQKGIAIGERHLHSDVDANLSAAPPELASYSGISLTVKNWLPQFQQAGCAHASMPPALGFRSTRLKSLTKFCSCGE